MAARIYWLASYPRSGNTWLRVLLANALYDDARTSQRIAELIPNIHFGVTGRHLMLSPFTIVKTHWPYREDLPLRGEVAGAIYLLRHPADVMASTIRYQYMTGLPGSGALSPAAIRRRAREWAGLFLKRRGAPHWHRSGFGGWDDHVQSWTETNRSIPVHVVRYEDLKADTAARLAAICEFVGSPADPVRIEAAVARSSLERMRRLEQAEIDAGVPHLFHGSAGAQPAGRGLRFIDSANSTVGRLLEPTGKERAAARDVFAATLARFGYA